MSSVNTATSVKQVIKEIEDPNYLAQKELVEKDILKYFDDPQFPTAQEKAFMLENLDDFWFGKWYDERMELYDELIGLDKDLISELGTFPACEFIMLGTNFGEAPKQGSTSSSNVREAHTGVDLALLFLLLSSQE